jgi:hypothetical protein
VQFWGKSQESSSFAWEIPGLPYSTFSLSPWTCICSQSEFGPQSTEFVSLFPLVKVNTSGNFCFSFFRQVLTITQADLDLLILLPQLPEMWGYLFIHSFIHLLVVL